MSAADAGGEQAARDAFGPAERGQYEVLPPRRPLAGWWDFMVRGWRPAASWTCVLILLLRGVIVPVVELWRHQPVTPVDLLLLGVLLGALKLAHDRRIERSEGITS